jgi:hypothetical protein
MFFFAKSISTDAQYVALHWKILDEVQQSYPVDSLEDCSHPEQCTVSRALEEPWPAELLLVVSHLFAVPGLVLWVGLEKSK